MNPPLQAQVDGSLAKATVRLVAAGLAALALLPPLVWGVAAVVVERHAPGSGSHAPDGPGVFAGSSVALVALASAALALALWAFVFHRPVRELRQADRRMRTLGKRDTLTGLPNRDGLRFALEHALARRRPEQVKVGVLVIDVDRFRLVNDSLGSAAGDELLRSVAARIRAVVRGTDIVARFGADQFVVQVEGSSGVQALTIMARNLLRAFEPTHSVGGRDTVATLSIGVAVEAEHAASADALLKCADVAMRAAKAAGGARFRCFEVAMHVDDEKRLDLDLRLRRALRDSEFKLVFQPIVDARGERVVAVEALLRWAEPGRGMMSPADFIPVLEQTGLIVDVGHWVLRDACRQARGWIAGGAGSLVLSVNVSPRQFAEGRFVERVAAVLAETRFPANRLQLEVTEGLLLDPSPETLRKIGALVDTGVRLAIDDFGMGYSSLAYLKTFALHTLKIDRMFVRDIALHERDAAIARAIIDLGHGLGLKVTAEGVETTEQFHALRDLGCDSLQGYLFSRPIGAAELLDVLAQRGTPGDGDDGANGATPTLMRAPASRSATRATFVSECPG